MTVLENLKSEQIIALKSKQKDRLKAIRLILAEVKKLEVDSRKEITDQDIFNIFNKMLKQRQDSISEYKKASRQDLLDIEEFEVSVIKEFLPEPLTDVEILSIIDSAILELKATSIKDMGAVMSAVKPKLLGRSEMSFVTSMLKEKLS